MATPITLTHSTIKVPGQRVFAIADWNSNHQITADLDISPYNFTTTGVVNIGAAQTGGVKQLFVKCTAPTNTGLVVDMAAGQSVNPFEIRNSAGQGVMVLTPSGSFQLNGTNIILNPLTNSDIFLEIDKPSAGKKGVIKYSINSVDKWFAGTTDSGNFGAGTEYFIGQTNGGANNALLIDTDNSISCNQKTQMTPIGGFAVMLTNKTGVNSVAGDIVIASAGFADAVDWGGINELQSIGVFLDSGITDGSQAWVVVGGIADVHMDAGGCALGDRIIAGGTARRGEVNNLPTVAKHFQEIGHAIGSAGANANARIVMHIL